MMSPEQTKHLGAIKDWIKSRLDAKYTAGQSEHGGNLWERKTINDMEGEIVDLCTYYFCVREVYKTINNLVVRARFYANQGQWNFVQENLDAIYELTKIEPNEDDIEHNLTKSKPH